MAHCTAHFCTRQPATQAVTLSEKVWFLSVSKNSKLDSGERGGYARPALHSICAATPSDSTRNSQGGAGTTVIALSGIDSRRRPWTLTDLLDHRMASTAASQPKLPTGKGCFKCGKSGHWSRDCTAPPSEWISRNATQPAPDGGTTTQAADPTQ